MIWLLVVLGVSVLFNVWQHLVIMAYRSETRLAAQRVRNMHRILESHARNGSKVS